MRYLILVSIDGLLSACASTTPAPDTAKQRSHAQAPSDHELVVVPSSGGMPGAMHVTWEDDTPEEQPEAKPMESKVTPEFVSDGKKRCQLFALPSR
jgi:hypothetical protein